MLRRQDHWHRGSRISQKELLERGVRSVSGGEEGISKGPADGEIGIVPSNAALRLRIIGSAHFVLDESRFAEGAVTMRKSDGDKELLMGPAVELYSFPLAKCRGGGANVDGDVPDRSL